ncbi:MAG: type II toxin-antitoxin system HicB family antitoxin [Patescibacteria group bacterium]|nr:type II toxin-antitoxin system HicB family antitoxin [Patescibacteria group bacterium]
MIKNTRKIKKQEFSVLIEKDESGFYFAKVPTIKGCHTQAKSLSELYKRLDEAVLLCLEVQEKDKEYLISKNEFVGFQKIEVKIPPKLKYA